MSQTLVDALRRRARDSARQSAYCFLDRNGRPERRLTYGDLEQRAEDIAARLARQTHPGDRVLICQAPGIEYVCSLFGCLLAGAVSVPAHPPRLNQKFERLQAVAGDSGAKVLLTTKNMREQLRPSFQSAGQLGRLALVASDDCPNLSSTMLPHEPSPETLALLQYTSGSMANPKGVMLSHANLTANIGMIAEAFELGADSRGVIWLPPFHDMGLVGGLLAPLAIGFPVALMSPFATLQRPHRWLEAMHRFRGTISGGPSFAYEMCVRRIDEGETRDLDLSNWRVAFCGAEPVRHDTLQRFADKFAGCGFRSEAFAPCYGLAEATLMATSVPKGDSYVVCHPDTPAPGCTSRPLASCGFPHNGHRVAVVDPETSRACPDDVVGEIWISGASVAMGYWNRPRLTQAVFDARLSGDTARSWLRTGDLGLIRGGALFVTGRRDNVIVVRGRNHCAEDIEQTVVESHPGLKPARTAVVAVDLDWNQEVVVLQEIGRQCSDADAQDALRAIQAEVRRHHGIEPWAVCLLAEHKLPVTSSGKVCRPRCLELFVAGRLQECARWERLREAPVS